MFPEPYYAGRCRKGIAFAMYTSPTSGKIGRIGSSIPIEIRRAGFVVDSVSWDFLTIALAVIAADQGCLRQGSADGWTRQISLCVSVQSPLTWRQHAAALERALGFLTRDIWTLEFEGGGPTPPHGRSDDDEVRGGQIRATSSACSLAAWTAWWARSTSSTRGRRPSL